jgi:redox-sensitive bicupin YhaK (pirin superfamily)
MRPWELAGLEISCRSSVIGSKVMSTERTRSEAHVSSRDGCRVLLIGGPPFPEQILMWRNFVARTQDEIAQAAR